MQQQATKISDTHVPSMSLPSRMILRVTGPVTHRQLKTQFDSSYLVRALASRHGWQQHINDSRHGTGPDEQQLHRSASNCFDMLCFDLSFSFALAWLLSLLVRSSFTLLSLQSQSQGLVNVVE